MKDLCTDLETNKVQRVAAVTGIHFGRPKKKQDESKKQKGKKISGSQIVSKGKMKNLPVYEAVWLENSKNTDNNLQEIQTRVLM